MKKIKIILMCLMVTGLLFGCGGSSGNGGSDDGGGNDNSSDGGDDGSDDGSGDSFVINPDGSLTLSGTVNPPPGDQSSLLIYTTCGNQDNPDYCVIGEGTVNADGSFNITIPEPRVDQLTYLADNEDFKFTKIDIIKSDFTLHEAFYCVTDNELALLFYANTGDIYGNIYLSQGWNTISVYTVDSEPYKEGDGIIKNIFDTCVWKLDSDRPDV